MTWTWSLKNIFTKSPTSQTTTFPKYRTGTQLGKEYLIPYRTQGFSDYRLPIDPTPSQFNPIHSLLLLTAFLKLYLHVLGNKTMWKHLYRNKRQHNSNSTRQHINIYEPVTFISASIRNSNILCLYTGQIIFLLETVLKNKGIYTNARNYFNRNLHFSKSECDLASYTSWLPTACHKIWLSIHRSKVQWRSKHNKSY